MRQKKVKLSAILLLGLGLAGTQAQSTLYVNTHSGTQTPFTLSSIKKLTFESGSMTVNKTSGSIDSYLLTDMRYLNFTDLTTGVSLTDKAESSDMLLYPNPVIDQLQINYESLKIENVQVEIVDLQGRVLHQQTIISQNGTNQLKISVSQLSKGLYVCRFKSDDKIEIIKFIKN